MKIHCADYPEIIGITSDYKDFLDRSKSIDIVICSLFCHHLNDYELVNLFNYFMQHLKTGFIINDLQRNRFAYYSAWIFPHLLNGSSLAKNDGPISVLRAFKSHEFKYLLNKAGIENFSMQKKWAFRFLIVVKTENNGTMAE
jgi:hypothetical protein